MSSAIRKRAIEGASRSESPSGQPKGRDLDGPRSLSTSPVRKTLVRKNPWTSNASKALLFISLVAFILRFALINEPAEVVYGLLPTLAPFYGL